MVREWRGKIAVIGEHDSILGFRAVGCEVMPTTGPEETLDRLREVTRGGYGVVFLTESAAEAPTVQEFLRELEARPLPVVTLIPGAGGSRGLALASLRASVEKAVGADVLFQGEK